MRIGVDATGVVPAGKGIARVQRGVVAALRTAGTDDLVVFARHPDEVGGAVRVKLRPTLAWEQFGLARAVRTHDLDVLLTWTERLPLIGGGTYAVWLFELPQRRIEQNRRAGASRYQRASDLVTNGLWRRSLERAALVFTGSLATAGEVLQAMPELEGRVRALYPGLDDVFQPAAQPEDPPYVLHLASADTRDDSATALRAFEQARKQLGGGVRLLVAGDPGPLRTELADAAGQDVEFVGRVDDRALARLYRGASAFVDTSLFEGFGYQVLEAMASGAPVVASDVSSIPELTGDAALLCPPGSAEGFADGLTRVLSDSALAQDLRTRGPERARRFTWGRTVEELRAGLAELA